MNEAQEKLLNLMQSNELSDSESEVVINVRPLRKLGNESIVNIAKSDAEVLEAVLKYFYIEDGRLFRLRSNAKPTKISLKKSDNNPIARTKVTVSYGRVIELSLRNIIYMLHTKQCIPIGMVVKLNVDDEEKSINSLVFDNMYLAVSANTNNIFSSSVPEKTPERFTGLSSIRRLPDVFPKTSNFKYKQYAGYYYLVAADNTIDYHSFHKDWRVVLNQKLSVGVWYMPEGIVMDREFPMYPWIKEIYDTLWSLNIAPGYHTNTIVFKAEEPGKERVYTWRPKSDSLLPIYTNEYNATSIPNDLYHLCVSEKIDPHVIFMADYTAYTSDSDNRREFKNNMLRKMGDHVYDHLRIMLIEKLEDEHRPVPEWLYPVYASTFKYYSIARDYSKRDPNVTFNDMKLLKFNAKNPKHLDEMIKLYFGNTKLFPLFEMEETAVDMQTSQPRSEKELAGFRKQEVSCKN